MGSPYGAAEAFAVLGEDEYVCTLPPEVRKVASRDLMEDEATRVAGLKAMREFVARNTAITKCRLGELGGLVCGGSAGWRARARSPSLFLCLLV